MQMTMREAKTDVDELMDDAEFEVGDSAHKMRKVGWCILSAATMTRR